MLFIIFESCNLLCCLTKKGREYAYAALHQPVLLQLCLENVSEDMKLFYEALRLPAFSFLRNTHTHTHAEDHKGTCLKWLKNKSSVQIGVTDQCHDVHVNKWQPFFIPKFLFVLWFYFLNPIFSLCTTSPSCSLRVTFDILLMLPCFHFFFSLPSTLTPQLTRSKCPLCPSDLQIIYIYIFFFFLICLCHSILVRLSICLSHSHIFFFFWLPHFLTRISPSLVSRTLATRTVMSSMRSWILQLWPPLPAHEALLTLAQGILSSMQPSSLAHTSACQYRAFPPQTLASRYTDWRTPLPRRSPFSHTDFPSFFLLFYVPHVSFVCLSLESWPLVFVFVFCFFWSRSCCFVNSWILGHNIF